MKKILLLGATALLLSSNLMASDKLTAGKAEKIGKKVSKDLLKTLGGNMKSHLKSEGLLGAAKFCNASAYELTQQVKNKYGQNVEVKRISLKYRNAANKPSEDEAKVLHALESLKEAKAMPKFVLQKNKNNFKFFKPLVIKKGVCLKCHGNIEGKVSTFMKEHYPQDKATGYKMHDLRGAVVVTITKKKK